MKAEGVGWGKLFIAGEYAVVHPGHPAIVMATQRCIRVIIEPSSRFELSNPKHNREIAYDDLNQNDNYWKYALSAVKVFYRLLDEQGIEPSFVSISVESDLDSEDGKKLGLGSSGAIVAAIVKGLNEYYKLKLNSHTIFKLCVISQSELQVTGSFGDLASAVYGGVIRYSRFDNMEMNKSISDLIAMEWPSLSIEYIDLPFNLHWVVGWTGQPSSTQNQVDKVKLYENNVQYLGLLDDAKQIVNEMASCRSSSEFLEGIKRYRQWLLRLENLTDLLIETAQIKTFIELCKKYNGEGKSSGAGGGDCAIAFFEQNVLISDILLSEGIKPLTIMIAKKEGI